jgi:hypothetical protein
MIKMVTGIVAFCQSPTLDNFTKVTKLTIDKDAQTCLIASNHFYAAAPSSRCKHMDRNSCAAWPMRHSSIGSFRGGYHYVGVHVLELYCPKSGDQSERELRFVAVLQRARPS